MFVNCKQSKNKYVFTSSFSPLSALSYVPLFPTFTTITTCYISVLISKSSQRWSSTVSFKRSFTQGWLNSYYSSSALSRLFIVLHKQSNENSFLAFSVTLSQLHCYLCIMYTLLVVYCVHIVGCVLCTHCWLFIVYILLVVYCVHIVVCTLSYLSTPFSHACCCWFSFKEFKPCLFSSNATSHKADWILTTRPLLCLAFI